MSGPRTVVQQLMWSSLKNLESLICMKLIDSHRRVDEGVTVGNCMMNRLLFADELLLHAWIFTTGSSARFSSFYAACDQAGTKISAKKIEVLCLSRHPRQCMLQVSGNTLQQVNTLKYLGVVFTSDESRNKEINTQIGETNAVLRELYYSVVAKRKLSKSEKLSVFKLVFVPILNCGD